MDKPSEEARIYSFCCLNGHHWAGYINDGDSCWFCGEKCDTRTYNDGDQIVKTSRLIHVTPIFAKDEEV